ncbi:calcium-binding protein [Baaleninema sp.]|uniref:calcium-binding protein n=1 Tax=Baaleninema sp. TaxID=3101197 RepID=UPI003D03C675
MASLTQAIDETPDSGNPVTLDGQLSQGDFLALPAVTDYSLADEYRVEAQVPGETLEAVVSSAVGFSPRLQILDVTNGTITDDVAGVGTPATEPLTAGNEYRVRVFAQGRLGEQDTRDYELVLNAPNGVEAAELEAGEGGGVSVVNTPTQAPDPPASAPDLAQYARFNKGEKGSISDSSSGKPVNRFNLIGLSDGSDSINLGNPPSVGTPPIFTDLVAGITGGTPNFEDARWVVAFDGNDTLTGTSDNNVPVVGNQGNDTFNLGDGADVGVGGADSDRLNGDGGDDILNGNRGTDIVNGNGGADTLNGGGDDDVLNGGSGNDQLSGDRGQDLLIGDGDADTFVLRASTAAETAAEADVITDFNPAEADRIQLEGASFADVRLKAAEIAIDVAPIQPATAIQDTSSGQYLGVLRDVSPYEVAAIADTVFV